MGTSVEAQVKTLDKKKIKTAASNLNEQLYKNAALKRMIIITMVSLLIVLFIVGVYLVLFYRDDPKTMGAILGGTFLSLVGIIAVMHRIWSDISRTDILMTIIGKLAPDKQVELFIAILNYDKERAYNLNKKMIEGL